MTAADVGAGATDYREASTLYRGGKFAEAAEAFKRANKAAGGRCDPCLRSLASAQAKSGQLDAAIETAHELVSLADEKSKLASAYANLGSVLTLRGALAHLKRKDAPTPQSKDLAEAEEAFRKALDQGYPDRVGLLANIAAVRSWRGDNAGTAEAARQAIELHPTGQTEVMARMSLCAARLTGKIPGRAEEKEVAGKADTTVGPGTTTQPQLLYGPKPAYPKAVKGPQPEGVAKIEAIIDEEGCILLPRVLKSLDPDLDRAAVEAVKTWAFRPAEIDGKPVKVYYTLTVNFSASAAEPAPGAPRL